MRQDQALAGALCMKFRVLWCALLSMALGAPAAHANDLLTGSTDGAFWVSGGVGVMSIEAHEHVYLGDDKASQLDWNTDGIALYTLSAGADLGGDWHIKGTVDLGLGGDGHMVDYDWVPGAFIDQSMDGWSDRSIHPDTRLNYYVSGTLELGRTVFTDDRSTVSVGGGVKYTEVNWDAFGGSYIYSNGGVRNDVGDIPADVKGISYQQKIPTIFLGVDGSTRVDRLTLSGGVKGGLTPGIEDKDDHWLNSVRVFGDMYPAPVLMLNAALDYELTETASISVAGTYEHVFPTRGDTNSIDTTTGVATLYPNAAGASLQTMSLQLGFRGRF